MTQENITQTQENIKAADTAAEAAVISPGMVLEMIPPENTETMSTEAAETAEDIKVIGILEEKETDKKDEIVEIALATVVDDEELNVEYTVKLSKKYMFEGDVIDEIDLSGLEDLGYEGLKEIEKIYKKIATRYTSTPDLTDEYALATAAFVTGKPIEFFTHILAKDIRRIRNCVIGFFYTTD